MMSARISQDHSLAICADDSQLTDSYIIPLEVQNTVVECTRNGSAKELENILRRIFYHNKELSLNAYISFYQILSSLLHVILSSMNVEENTTNTLKTLNTQTVYNPWFMYHLLLEDFLTINRCCSTGQAIPRYQIMEYIQQHYMEPLSLDSIADEFGITPVYLSTWFKKNVGINLSVHITNVRMEAAKKLLTENRNRKVLEIAQDVGIPSISTFIRQFKNYTGTTPDQYRKLN